MSRFLGKRIRLPTARSPRLRFIPRSMSTIYPKKIGYRIESAPKMESGKEASLLASDSEVVLDENHDIEALQRAQTPNKKCSDS